MEDLARLSSFVLSKWFPNFSSSPIPMSPPHVLSLDRVSCFHLGLNPKGSKPGEQSPPRWLSLEESEEK